MAGWDVVAAAVIGAVGAGAATVVGAIVRTRATTRTAARLIYAELIRNGASVAFYLSTGAWPQTTIVSTAWDKRGEVLARLRGVQAFDAAGRVRRT